MSGKQQSPTPAVQEKRPPINQAAELMQVGLTPEAASLAAIGGTAQNGLPPNHPTAARLRQATVLQMQRRYGNAYVQRMMAQQNLGPYASSPLVQLQEEEGGDGDTPTEAEKAAALAAAAAAEAVAGSAASEGKQKTAKSRAEKAKEQEAGQSAKEQAGQKSAAAKAKAGEAGAAAPGVNGAAKTAGPAKPETAAAGAAKGESKGAKAAVNGAGPGVNGTGPDGKAPASAEEDPAFQAVTSKVKQAGKAEKAHDPAEKKAGEAQAAAESPASELASKAQTNQVGKMEKVETPGFDAAGFKAKLMERIAALAPKTTKEADDFKENDRVAGVKEEMKGQAAEERDKSTAPMEEATAAAPDTAGVEPKPVTPLPPPEPGEAPGDIGAEAAAPKPKTTAEVETPIQENTKQVDEKMAEADVTDEQLEKSNEPEFQGALKSKKEAKQHAETAPGNYRQAEDQQITQAQGEAATTTQADLQAMHGDKAQALQQVATKQGQTKSEDEKERQKVAADIQKIYDKTKTNVERILGELDGKVDQAFDAGAAEAKKAFEDYVEAKMNAYKERRYGGWFGWARWAKDKIAGMPGEVNAFYTEGRNLYLGKMDAVIDNVVAIIGRTLAEAKREIAQGKQEIQDYVVKLPANLRQVGQQAAEEMQGKFSELEQSVDNKQNELIDRLAQKYQENLQAVDSRIEELKAANKGLVDAALDAIGGVIKTILKLKDMLLNVLKRAADAIGKIIRDPIGFLGNLLGAVKKGFMNFVANIGTHLKKGLMTWLFGEVAKAGIQLPESFDVKGILTLVMQVLGITWENLRARAVKMFGERVVAALEKAFEVFKIIKEQGLAGLWEYIKEKISNLKDMVFDGIKDMVITQVIKAGVQWLMGLLGGPAGAFIKAAKAIYDIIMWFINNGSQLMSLIDAILGSISAIASGAVDSAASFVENALAKAIPVVIGFLASLLGLGGFSEKIRGIIQKVKEPIDRAIDWVLDKAKAVVKKIGSMLGLGKKGKEAEGGSAEANAKAKEKARQRVASASQKSFKDEGELKGAVKQIETDLIPEGLKSLTVVAKQGKSGQYDVIARAAAGDDVGDVQIQGAAELTDEQKAAIEQKIANETTQMKALAAKVSAAKEDEARKKAVQEAAGEARASAAYKVYLQDGSVNNWIKELKVEQGLDAAATGSPKNKVKGATPLNAAIKELSALLGIDAQFQAAGQEEKEIGDLKLTGDEILQIIREVAQSVWDELSKQAGSAVQGAASIRGGLTKGKSQLGVEITEQTPTGESKTTGFEAKGTGYEIRPAGAAKGRAYGPLLRDLEGTDEGKREAAKSELLAIISTAELARDATVLVTARQIMSILRRPGPLTADLMAVVRQFPMIMRGSSDASVGVNVRVAPGQTDLSKPIPPEREQFVAQNPKVPGIAQAQIESFVQSVNDMGKIKRHLGKVTEKPEQIRLIKFYVREQATKIFSRQITKITEPGA